MACSNKTRVGHCRQEFLRFHEGEPPWHGKAISSPPALVASLFHTGSKDASWRKNPVNLKERACQHVAGEMEKAAAGPNAAERLRPERHIQYVALHDRNFLAAGRSAVASMLLAGGLSQMALPASRCPSSGLIGS